MKTKTKTQQAQTRPIAPQVCYIERAELADRQLDPLILFRKPVPEMAEGVRVLVIELSEESMQRLADNVAGRLARIRDGRTWSHSAMEFATFAIEAIRNEGEETKKWNYSLMDCALIAVGAKPVRVAKRKKAK